MNKLNRIHNTSPLASIKIKEKVTRYKKSSRDQIPPFQNEDLNVQSESQRYKLT